MQDRMIEVPVFVKSIKIKRIAVEVEIAVGSPKNLRKVEREFDVDIFISSDTDQSKRSRKKPSFRDYGTERVL